MSRTRQPEKDSFYVGLRILEYLVSSRSSRGVSQIASALRAPVSSTHDILQLLLQLGFVSRQPRTHRYEVTTNIFRLINTFSKSFGIVPHVHKVIHKHTEQHQCTIYLSRIWQGETHVVYAQGPMASTASIGGHDAPHLSAAAKSLISLQPPSTWQHHAPSANPEAFIKELRQARSEGVAWNLRKTNPRVCAVAMPLGTRDELAEYAVAMVFQAQDFRKWDRLHLLETLRSIRDDIATSIPSS